MVKICLLLVALCEFPSIAGAWLGGGGVFPRATLTAREEASISRELLTLSQAASPLAHWWLDMRLVRLLRRDFEAYGRVASRLHLEAGLPRARLPNLEQVEAAETPNATMTENLVEAALLELTRWRYAVRAPVTVTRSHEPGIRGLLAEMRQVAFVASADEQRELVVAVLKDLATGALPVFYRLFVGGCRPSVDRGDPRWLVDALRHAPFLRDDLDAQPPPFYAPFLTSLVAPLVFSYLVGPASLNRRSDGRPGGIVVVRCKFLQESNCKGLCLHQCKLPAQQLFVRDLSVPLHVKPNFETYECQWSWGLAAPPPEADPAWPKGCLDSCPSRHPDAAPWCQ